MQDQMSINALHARPQDAIYATRPHQQSFRSRGILDQEGHATNESSEDRHKEAVEALVAGATVTGNKRAGGARRCGGGLANSRLGGGGRPRLGARHGFAGCRGLSSGSGSVDICSCSWCSRGRYRACGRKGAIASNWDWDLSSRGRIRRSWGGD